MLKAVVSDFIHAIIRGRPVERPTNTAPRVHADLHYARSVPALTRVRVSADNAGGVAAAITQIEQSNRYIPSAFKAVLEFTRYQVESARGLNAKAIEHLRAAVAQAPYQEDLLAEYKRLVERTGGPTDIVLVISCKRYEDKAIELANQLGEANIESRIISGSDTLPIDHPHAVQLDVPDNYESLPRKVAGALRWVYENLGTDVGVLKVDDDQTLIDVQAMRGSISALHMRNVYAGVPVSGVTHDRNWHWNKCESPELNTRTYGKPFFRRWAMGGAYYLGPGPLEKVVLFLTRFPGMFEGEYYEDKLVGDVLHFEEVPLEPLGSYRDLGLMLREEHRFNVV